MKKYITILTVAFTATIGFSQVAVEKADMTNGSVILEFNDQRAGGVAKGLILPVSDGSNATAEGSVWLGEDGIFKVQKAAGTVVLSNAGTVTAVTLPETGAGTIIEDGSVADTSGAVGVLELRSTTKAMILPHVSDVTTALPNPQTGTWVYDTSKKALAFFNGTEWEFNYGG